MSPVRFLVAPQKTKVKRKKTYRLISLLLLTLFVSYRVGIFSFTHLHIVNGVIIAHSHPYSNKSHSHTTAEFITIAQLSTIQATENESIFSFSLVESVVCELITLPNSFHQLLKHEHNVPPRAPPFYC